MSRAQRAEMTSGLDITALRSAVVFIPVIFAIGLWFAAAPPVRLRGAVLLAVLWNFTFLIAANAFAVKAGWWIFGTEGLGWAGVPVDVIFGWSVLWGAVPLLMGAWIHPFVTASILLVADALAMGGLAPMVNLAPNWWWGEALCTATGLIPGLALGYATAHNRWLRFRVLAQVALFGSVLLFLIPTATFGAVGTDWSAALDHVGGPLDLILAQIALLFALVGLRAVAEFAQHGGTPFPWDPPDQLVTTGPYGYIANPMQLSAILLLVIDSAMTAQPSLALVAVGAAAFSGGIAAWNERDHLRIRFGDEWTAYRLEVRNWWPRFRPTPLRSPATLFTADTCEPCSEVNSWFRKRSPIALQLDPAENHPEDLRRVRYENRANGRIEVGTRAVGAALEHISLAWALVGWVMRVPVLAWFVQLVVDALGGGPRSITSETDPRKHG